jgi:hypothetical protein
MLFYLLEVNYALHCQKYSHEYDLSLSISFCLLNKTETKEKQTTMDLV